jgi:hypothetical protein
MPPVDLGFDACIFEGIEEFEAGDFANGDEFSFEQCSGGVVLVEDALHFFYGCAAWGGVCSLARDLDILVLLLGVGVEGGVGEVDFLALGTGVRGLLLLFGLLLGGAGALEGLDSALIVHVI